MPFLTLNGLTVRVKSNALPQKYNEDRLDRARMFDGTMRMTRGGVYRQWDVTTALLADADANTLLALVNGGALLTASGDVVGSPVVVMPVPGGDTPVQSGATFKRQVTFTLHETPTPLPPDRTAVPWAFLQRGLGYWQDASKTVPALDGDPVWVWADQSGNARDGLASTHLAAGGDIRPTRDGDQVHFGVGPGSTPSVGHSRTIISFPSLSLLNEVEVMLGLRAALDPPATTNRANAFTFNSEGVSSDVSHYPDTDGHVYINFGFSRRLDIGDPAADLTSLHVLSMKASNVTKQLTVYLDNVQVFQYTLVGAEVFAFDTIVPNLGWGFVGNGSDLGWDGWHRDAMIIGGLMTDTQRRSWYDYMRGATTDPPLPI